MTSCSASSGATTTGQIGAGDWFGGVFPGTDFVDQANPAVNLSITESTVNLSGFAGETLTSITFQNAGNQNAGYAISRRTSRWTRVSSSRIRSR